MNRQYVSGAVIFTSIALAAALAIYESETFRQLTEEFGRKIKEVFTAKRPNDQKTKDNDSRDKESTDEKPRSNWPEDSEGFIISQGCSSSEIGADEETKRRKREDVLFWNKMKLAGENGERQDNTTPTDSSHKDNFDRSSQQSKYGKQETFVYSSGAKINSMIENNLRNRGQQDSVSDIDPFSDKHVIGIDSQSTADSSVTIEMKNQEVKSDNNCAADAEPSDTALTNPKEKEKNNHPVNISHDEEIFASIHAWAENTHSGSYTNKSDRTNPISASPNKPHEINENEFETSSVDHDQGFYGSLDGDATPTNSASRADSADIAGRLQSGLQSEDESFDVMSLSGSRSCSDAWTDVGSVVSENDVV